VSETSSITPQSSEYLVLRVPLVERGAYYARVLRVLAVSDFKLKYAGSVLGYVWSLMKPLAYFAVLWVVFGGLFKSNIPKFPLYLLLGVVMWTFVADAVTTTLPSIVARGAVLRRIAFPPIVIPLAATITALMTFGLNLIIIVVFIAGYRVVPNIRWLLLGPLLLELYLFVLGLSLLMATLNVRFRDISQIWEVASQLLFFTAPVMYPASILPVWARHIVVFNPFVQILMDTRRVILGRDSQAIRLIGLHGNHVIPLTVIACILLLTWFVYRRQSPRFAEVA
jgi:ABC-2 type transport system permease protein